MSELKPCPFCGEPPVTEHAGNTWSICCDTSTCSMAAIHGPDFDQSGTVTAWNSRVTDTDIAALQSAQGEAVGIACAGYGETVGQSGFTQYVKVTNLIPEGTKLYTHPAPVAVPEGWELRKVEAEETTISVHRKSDGKWCAGGQLGAYGRHGLLFEFFDAMLTATPAPDHIADAGKVAFVDGLGAQRMTAEECKEGIEYIIHGDNIYWPLSDDDELRLIQAACGNGEFTYPQATPSVPENEIKALALEEYADQLDAVFANAQEAGATDCPAWHAGQFAKDARKQAARLRSNGGGA